MLESKYQAHLIKTLYVLFPGCFIIKQDYRQGMPDLLILWDGMWGMLEVKESASARHQPNQDYYVEKFDAMSFARFIYPENEKDILRELEQEFATRRAAFFSVSQQSRVA